MHANSIGGKFNENLDGTARSDADEENKAMYGDGHEGLMGSIGLTDNGLNADDTSCKKCNKPIPPNELTMPANENVDWLCCERCQNWYHAVCV